MIGILFYMKFAIKKNKMMVVKELFINKLVIKIDIIGIHPV